MYRSPKPDPPMMVPPPRAPQKVVAAKDLAPVPADWVPYDPDQPRPESQDRRPKRGIIRSTVEPYNDGFSTGPDTSVARAKGDLGFGQFGGAAAQALSGKGGVPWSDLHNTRKGGR